MASDWSRDAQPTPKPKAEAKARAVAREEPQASKTAALALQPYAPSGKRPSDKPIEITRDPEGQSTAIGQTVVYRVNLPVNGKYRWRVDRGSGFDIEHPVVSQLRRAPNEWAITWSQAGEYEVICEVLYLPQPREGHPVPFTVKADVRVSYASNVAHEAVMKAVAKADGATSYESYHKQREREHAEMTGKGASPFANETSDASDPFIGAMPINGPAVLEGKSHDQTYVLNYWKGDPATLKWMVIPRSPDSKGQRLIRIGHGAAPTFSFTEPGLYDVVCTQRVAKQSRTGGTHEEFVPVTATVQAILSANGKAQADELRKKIAHADSLIAKIAKDPETHHSRAVAITGVHVAASANKIEHLPLFIGPSAEHSNAFVVVDLRPGIARSEHVGPSPEAALQAFEAFAEKNYPKGSVNLHIFANSEHIAPQQRSFETQSKIHWDHVGEQIGWISAGLVVSGLGLLAAGVTAPVGMIMLGAAAAGTIAGAATLKGHIDEGASAKQYTIDVMQLAAGLVGFRAFGNLAAYAMQVPNVAKSMIAVEFGLNSGSIGLMSTDVAEELVTVNSDASLSEDERDTRRWQITLNLLGQAGFFWLGYRGAKNDFKITNQIRVVRPDELEQHGAAPRKHEPDMDELSSGRRRNIKKWGRATRPVTQPTSAFVIRDNEIVPVHKMNGSFYDPRRRKVDPQKERVHQSMAGGAPEQIFDPVPPQGLSHVGTEPSEEVKQRARKVLQEIQAGVDEVRAEVEEFPNAVYRLGEKEKIALQRPDLVQRALEDQLSTEPGAFSASRSKEIPVLAPQRSVTSFVNKSNPAPGVHELSDGVETVFFKTRGAQAEVVSSMINDQMGLSLVPRTQPVEYDGKIGSAQQRVPLRDMFNPTSEPNGFSNPPRKLAAEPPSYSNMRAFDFLIGHSDRDYRNFFVRQSDSDIRLIDNESSLPPAIVPTTLLSGRLPEQYTPEFVAGFAKLTEQWIRTTLGPMLSEVQLDGLLLRRRVMELHIQEQEIASGIHAQR